jgi:hypothetical protein
MPTARTDSVVGGRLVTAGLALAGCAVLVVWMGVDPGSFASLAQSATTAFSR